LSSSFCNSPIRRSAARYSGGRCGDYARALAEADPVLARKPTSGTLFYHAGIAHAAAASAVYMDATVARAERAQLAERYAARCVALLTEAEGMDAKK
jgi:hypothetical protein